MRFELTVALKYLIPRWRQLSVSIISLISVLVISLVVWLVVLFLSVTEGIEKKWVEELVALNAPVRMAPTDAYYQSYYYQIDRVSSASNYSSKTIGEKLASLEVDPYDPEFDAELPLSFPSPDLYESGTLKDVVKEGWLAALTLKEAGARPQEYEVSFGNLRLSLLREESEDSLRQTHLNQVSYVASLDSENGRLSRLLLQPSAGDFNNLLNTFFFETEGSSLSMLAQNIALFFDPIETLVLQTKEHFPLPASLYPQSGHLKGIGLIRSGKVQKIVIPSSVKQLAALEKSLSKKGFETDRVGISFEQNQMLLSTSKGVEATPQVALELEAGIPFDAILIKDSLNRAKTIQSLKFLLKGSVQGLQIEGPTPYKGLDITQVKINETRLNSEPFWVYHSSDGSFKVPSGHSFGEGILVAKQFQSSGVKMGDRGYLAYYAPTTSSMQEQRIPVYVAGFYDPGIMPIGNKLIFVDPKITGQLRDNMPVADNMLGNGINIWLDDLTHAEKVKGKLVQSLKEKGLGNYWEVQSYRDYEFAKPLLQQLKSDKNLFTLIAVIILIVACSNIVSMLILLVNDKKREIGILQSMGASRKRIALIFGVCGFMTGFVGSVIGTLAAAVTLHYLQSLVRFLSFLQGHEAFQTAFYGNRLPNELSLGSMVFVIIATMIISLIAGIIPAVKASRIRPTEILKAE